MAGEVLGPDPEAFRRALEAEIIVGFEQAYHAPGPADDLVNEVPGIKVVSAKPPVGARWTEEEIITYGIEAMKRMNRSTNGMIDPDEGYIT